MEIAGEPVQFCNHQRCLLLFAHGERRFKLRAVLALPALNLSELFQQFPVAAIQKGFHR